MDSNEDCDLTVAQEDTAKVRIAITVSSGVGVLVGAIILIVMLSAKAYKSFSRDSSCGYC